MAFSQQSLTIIRKALFTLLTTSITIHVSAQKIDSVEYVNDKLALLCHI